ncbi:tetrameric acyl-CoA thioesterase [Corynebacterium sp. BCW_4722]|nr:tetrameric acyl-CoA thioesterase [Corynebacterium sp. BCW_4722]
MKLSPAFLRRFMWLWPPFFGAGVRVREFAEDGSRVVVTHKPNLLTQNGVGTAFGGTMMAMTDPFYMLASMARLGGGYNIWDAGAEVDFVKPGRGRLTAEMTIDDATYDLIKERTADGSKYFHWFETDIVDEEDDTVAHVRRRVYYRQKRK